MSYPERIKQLFQEQTNTQRPLRYADILDEKIEKLESKKLVRKLKSPLFENKLENKQTAPRQVSRAKRSPTDRSNKENGKETKYIKKIIEKY